MAPLATRPGWRPAACDAALGGGLGLSLLLALALTDNPLRRLALEGAAPREVIATLSLAFLAQSAVGAALSRFVLRGIGD